MRPSEPPQPQSARIPREPYKPAVTRSVHQPKPDTIRLWTFQPLNVWYSLREVGTLIVDPKHPAFADSKGEFEQAYDWMRRQMTRRIPGYAGHFPWWAYEHFLDLRFYRWTIPVGKRLVRLELAVPREQVLLSVYGSWHCVLGRHYLPASLVWEDYEREEDAWKSGASQHGVNVNGSNPVAEPWETEIHIRWERIFDVDRRRPTETIQATFEVLRLSDVVKVTEFTPMRNR